MPRTAMTPVPYPDPSIMTEVLRLADAVAAEWARRPPQPITVDVSTYMPDPETAEEHALRMHLATLDDDHQSRIHAAFWIGRDLPGRADQYEPRYHYALTTDLGAAGAAYLSEKPEFAQCLRRGLVKLGLAEGQNQPVAFLAQDSL